MNCFERVVKDFKYQQRKGDSNSIKGVAIFTVVSIVIVGAITLLFTEKCCEKMKDIIRDENDKDIKKNEIKETLEKASEESIGDLGVELKRALADMEE